MVCVTIVGTGDLAHGLAHLFFVNNNKNNGNGDTTAVAVNDHLVQQQSHQLLVTKPGLRLGAAAVGSTNTFHETAVPLVDMNEGIARADVIVLAIPASALRSFLAEYQDHLQEGKKIVVDATNSPRRGQDVISILTKSSSPPNSTTTSIQSVKAFHDIGAVEALLDKPANKRKIPVQMCSNYPDALAVVRTFAEESLGLDVKVIPYQHYGQIAQVQYRLDESWIRAIAIMLLLFVVTETYSIFRYNVYKGYEWFHLPLQVPNKAICWTSLNGFALSQLPGVLALIWNAVHHDNLRTKPVWLRRYLQLRKPLGLLSLWFLLVHVFMSLLLFGPAYYGKFFLDDPTSTKSTKLTALAENSMLFGVLGAALYVILGVCSLPSVGMHMNHCQWQLVYGPVAWTALAFGTVHVLIMGVQSWTLQDTWPAGMPPITMTSVLIPFAVMFLKVCQMVLVRLYDLCSTPTTHHSSGNHPKPPVLLGSSSTRSSSSQQEEGGDVETGRDATATFKTLPAEAPRRRQQQQPLPVVPPARRSTIRTGNNHKLLDDDAYDPQAPSINSRSTAL